VLSVAIESAEGWEDASLRVGMVGETRELRWPDSFIHWSVDRDRSKREVVSVVQTRKEAKGHA
jgi:hypothetical protein